MSERNFSIRLIISICLLFKANAQYSPQTYPDPRTDPKTCQVILPAQVCDPSGIITSEERRLLNDKILKLHKITANIKNKSPACINSQNTNFAIMVAFVDKLGNLPYESVNIEKFTNLLRAKYINYQDLSQCDSLILIVNSKIDREVFTVAGRDAKLTRDVLQTAFYRNVEHFRMSNYALGIEGMIEYIVSAYGTAHLVQNLALSSIIERLPNVGTANTSAPFVAAQGVRQRVEIKHVMPYEKFNLDLVPEENRTWVQLMLKASALCGYNADKMSNHVRAVVEDAMALSLKLISDTHYNKLEEDSQDFSKGPNARDKAWESSKSFIDSLYETYGQKFPRRANSCPQVEKSDVIARLLQK